MRDGDKDGRCSEPLRLHYHSWSRDRQGYAYIGIQEHRDERVKELAKGWRWEDIKGKREWLFFFHALQKQLNNSERCYRNSGHGSLPPWLCRVGFWIVAVSGFSVSIISEERVPSTWFMNQWSATLAPAHDFLLFAVPSSFLCYLGGHCGKVSEV